MSPRIRRLLASAAFPVALAVAVCFPFLARPLEVIPGDPILGECYVQPWSLWWVHHAIFREGTFPLWTDLLYYPRGGSFFSQMTWNAILLLPLGPLDLPSTLLLNLSLFLTMVAGGGFTFRLLSHLTKDRTAALVGTAIFMTCPLLVSFFRSGYLQGVNLVWLPLAWYLYLRMLEQRSVRGALAAALGMAALLLANLYAAISAGLLIALDCAWHARDRGRLPVLGLFALFGALLCLPILLWIHHTLTVSPLIYASGGISNETFFQFSNPDLVRFFLPAGEGDYFHIAEAYYVGCAALGFALFPALRGGLSRQGAFYGVAVLLTLGLALGPYLVVDGSMVLVDNRLIRLPFYYAYKYLPLFDVVRHPQRLMGVAYLSLAVLVALNFQAMRFRGAARAVAALLVGGLCVFEYLVVAPVVFPVPVASARPADYCDYLREQPGRFAVVALPYAGAFVQDGVFKHQQTFHGRSLQQGFDRRDPPELDEVRFLQALRRFQLLGEPVDPDDPGFAGDGERLARLGFRYVVVDLSLLKEGDAVTVPLLSRLFGPPVELRDGLVFPVVR